MPKSNKEKKSVKNLKRTARMSVRACCFANPRPATPSYQALSPATDYQTAPPSTPNVSPPLSPITSPRISLSKLLTTPKPTPPPLTSPPPAPTQPSKSSLPQAINLDPVKLIFSTPPTSPHAFFDSLEDLPPRTTNPPPPRPSFESIKHLANQPPPLPAMEPPLLLLPPQLLPLPPQLPSLGPNNPFPMLTHEMFCDHCQDTQVIVENLCEKMSKRDLIPIYDEAGPSYDSNTLFEVQDHDTFVDHMDEYHEVYEMQSDVQHNYVVDSDADYTSDSNIILYDQYVEDNKEHGVQSRLANKPDMVVNDSVTSELARYKELVGEYEKWAKFELTDRERKIDEQMRIIISDRNRKETSLKSELHSAQILLSSTVGHYKSKTEEVTILKKDFKQKEDKFLEEFLDIKRLKDKIEDRLYKQDQSVQTVHMLCKPKSFYDEKNKVAIGYKNPLCLTRAKQAQSALYNGHVLVTTNHTPTVVHDSEDTREIAEITRKRMLLKMQSPL
ncbi:hypothetical protein Tco_0003754, partial [Tanacetum coccineum]